jgi:hypothetical protein
MPIASGQAGHFRTLRRFIARGVIIAYFFLLISVGLAALGRERSFLTHGRVGVVLAVAFVPLTAGFALATKVLAAGDRGRSTRLTACAVGLLLLGITMILAATAFGV